MHNFTNKRLRDETNDKGRNFQVMAKDQERTRLRKVMPMPLSRNEKRQMGDGSKGAEQTVARAARRGQLISRSAVQIAKKVMKTRGALAATIAEYEAETALALTFAAPDAPAVLNPATSSATGSGLLDRAVPEVAAVVPPMGRGASAAAAARTGAPLQPPPAAAAGTGAPLQPPTEVGRGKGAGAGRGRGAAPRGRGRTRPATARDL
jgi:hypothetical protein